MSFSLPRFSQHRLYVSGHHAQSVKKTRRFAHVMQNTRKNLALSR